MNQNTKTSIIQRLARIAENATVPTKENLGGTNFMMSEGIAFALSNDFVDLFKDVARSLIEDENWSEKFSEKYVNGLLQRVLARTIRDGNSDKIKVYLDEIIEEFNSYSREHVVYVPLDGIKMSIDELPIGKVILRRMTDLNVKALMDEIEKIIQSVKHTPEDKAYLLKIQQREIGDNIKGRVCSVFKVVAEPEQARERAEEETRRIIDLFRYSIPALYPKGDNIAVGLQGEAVRVSRWIPILSTDGKSYNTHAHHVGSLIPFEINESNLEHMNKIGVFKLSKVLTKLDRDIGDFERVVLRAIHWFASSQTQEENENKLLNLITCLETLLTPRDSNPIGAFIAEAVAILLGKGIDERKRLKRRVKKLHRFRDAVSHGGRKAIFDSDLLELEGITGALTMHLINRMDEFKSHKVLFEWIEAKKLGSE
jgi:hypothetical protein